jgi:hypothetical protein
MRAQEAIAKRIAAEVEKLCIEAMGLRGSHCSESACSSSSFSTRDLDAAMERMAGIPKSCVGIVCQARYVSQLGQIQHDTLADVPPERRLFCGLPIYEKDQPEPWRAFFDHEEMRAYLDSPNRKAHS